MSLRVITFDVYNTLINYGKELIEEIAMNITKYLKSLDIEVHFDHVYEIYMGLDREIRLRRVVEMAYVPPMDNVRTFLERLTRKYGIELNERMVMDVANIIANTLLESVNVKPSEDAQYVLMEMKSDGFMIGVISNVIFWSSAVSRRLLDKFGLSKFIDVQVYADEVGRAKPHPAIFERAYSLLTHGVEPDVAIHVGDGFKEDLLGAMLDDIIGVYVDRAGTLISSGSPAELIRCRAYAVRKLKEVLLVPHIVSTCS
ncbi:HAD family hydrolase [Vulcanisaeta sp. JCM 16161]|uniref:HAD family hydrolase n=1 Tax=Vulcanisaeta sp. JCM 16161 TaxID=1295372 RepID=UPI0006D005C1|nr:HAD family hydrolase [Vulcanisaeta sp. JCM 16161]